MIAARALMNAAAQAAQVGLSFPSVSAERYALSAYTSADVLAWFRRPSDFWL
jgi:hypothetical protein